MTRIKYKEAAKLEVKKGKPAIGEKPRKAELKKLYVKESKSIRDVAETLGCSKDMIYRSLREYRIEMRNQSVKKSKLQDYELSFLKREIRKNGFYQVANELGVHHTTLRRYIKKISYYG